MDLELRHLRVVCTVAEAGSVTKAASTLGLAQPALTAQLRRIERMLGGPLFERDHRGVRPTALGELVLSRARVLLPAVDDLRDDATRLANTAVEDGAGARFRVGAVAGPILGRLVHHITSAHPAARVSTQTSWSSDELVAMVAAGRLDYVLIGLCGSSAPPAERGLVWQEISDDPVFVLLSDTDPLAGKEEIDLADLADAYWAATPGDGCFTDCFAMECAKAGFSPRTLYETEVASCIDLAASGDAVLLCQPMFREMPGVVPVPLAGAPLRWRQVLGWHRDTGSGEPMTTYAARAYQDVLDRSPRYTRWLATHPGYGAARVAAG